MILFEFNDLADYFWIFSLFFCIILRSLVLGNLNRTASISYLLWRFYLSFSLQLYFLFKKYNNNGVFQVTSRIKPSILGKSRIRKVQDMKYSATYADMNYS